jgi:hypothetical protein
VGRTVFNIKDQIFVLEIPKNGSRSLVYSVRQKYGKNYIKIEGHRTLIEMIGMADKLVSEKNRPIEPYTVAAVIRNPVKRFVSQVQQARRLKSHITLDEIMERAWHQADIVFKPQWQFVEVPTGVEIDLRMWDMERIGLALRFVAQRSTIPAHHINKAPPVSDLSIDQIVGHKMFDELIESEYHYKPDMALWIEAKRTNEDGQND